MGKNSEHFSRNFHSSKESSRAKSLCRRATLVYWEFGEGVDSAGGVTAIVVCRRNSSYNSSCDALDRNGKKTSAFFLLFLF